MRSGSSPSGRSLLRRGVTVTTALALGSAGVMVAATQAQAAAGCQVTYSVGNQWATGFGGSLAVTNLGDPITNGWRLEFSFAGNQRISQGWNAVFSQTGSAVTAANPTWNAGLATNQTVSPGFNATYSGTNTAPTVFRLNGVVCTGSVGGPTTPPTDPTTPPTDPGTPGTRVANPYVGRGYVNPEWAAKATAEPGGSRIANQPTAVWLDRIAAIEGTDNSSSNGSMGVRDHLDRALTQNAAYIQFVIYNLPGRDCAALASNGELGATELGRYQTEYIDKIAAVLADTKYRALRVNLIVEIDSLPNLVTNVSPRPTGTANCDIMKANGNYQKGIAYALGKFHAIPNVYNYIDVGHHGWLGWTDNFGPSAQLLADTARTAVGGLATVDGFITNTANYGATREPFIRSTEQTRLSKWIDYNPYVDELSYAQALRTELVTRGFASGIGMLIDTSRNGWGGSARPTAAVTTGSIDDQVNGSRIDRRGHLGNWCNQAGAGLGERPRANPEPGIDAYVWVKPPGESDGSSSLIPNDEGKGFDRMCDPTYGGNPRNNNNPTTALPGAPISGAWFSAQFRQLLANAFPAL